MRTHLQIPSPQPLQKQTDISQLTINSNVHFLQEVEQGRFEVYFGDGVVSKSLTDGNIVILQYGNNKTAANGANSFSSPSSISGITDIGVTLVPVQLVVQNQRVSTR